MPAFCVKFGMVPSQKASAHRVMPVGQVMVGGVASVTTTLKEQDAVCPLAAVTVKVLVVVPTGKFAPEARPAVCAVVAPEQLSLPTGTV